MTKTLNYNCKHKNYDLMIVKYKATLKNYHEVNIDMRNIEEVLYLDM